MITRLPDGCVVVATEETPDHEELDSTKAAIDDFLGSDPDHGMIYSKGRIYHSSLGKYQTGVRSHEVTKVIELSPDSALGAYKVMQCKDADLQQRFIKTMARWDPVERLAELRNNPSREVVRLPTPFTDFFMRSEDPGEQSPKFELFRAFRAYLRNQVSPPEPLSRNKGVSCGNFVAYSFKAAIVDYLFPQGLPDEIRTKLSQIEFDRHSGNKAKLSEINPKYFDELMELVQKHVTADKQQYLEYLQTKVKSTSVDEFCETAMQHPDIWEFKGYMFYCTDEGKNIPCLMDYQAYKEVAENYAAMSNPEDPQSGRESLSELETSEEELEEEPDKEKEDPEVDPEDEEGLQSRLEKDPDELPIQFEKSQLEAMTQIRVEISDRTVDSKEEIKVR